MNNINPLLMLDFYKVTHYAQYPKDLTKMVSYYTPRMSRLKDTNKVAMVGLQMFIKELQESFDKYFFSRPKDEVVNEYKYILDTTLGEESYHGVERIEKLHDLGYLPLMICAVPEGTRTNIGVPQIEITNTHPNFVWLVNTIETLLSCTMWHTQVSAEVGYRYRQIVNRYCELSCDSDVEPNRLLGDFSMRGQQSAESATKSTIGWLCSFMNTATVPGILAVNKYYNEPLETAGKGAISTEHSVMCSNYAVDGDEITHIRRLLTEVYPNHNFSMVSDSYDYWNLVDNILPQLKEEILNHNGCLSIRGDSGDPVEVIAGKLTYALDDYDMEILLSTDDIKRQRSFIKDVAWDMRIEEDSDIYFVNENKNRYFKVSIYPEWSSERGSCTDNKFYYIEDYNYEIEEIQPSSEIMGTVWALWQIFGGTINERGYKVLDPHIKAIYGDSITPQRCEEIYLRLMNKGFAINNVSLGVGSFSMMCLETFDDEGVHYNPYTRDTFGIAVKATYAEDKNGKPIMIYKQPKQASWKKSQKGCCYVYKDGENYKYIDELTWAQTFDPRKEGINELKLLWENGEFYKEFTLTEIRKNLHEGEF